jgi:hypothetical protein
MVLWALSKCYFQHCVLISCWYATFCHKTKNFMIFWLLGQLLHGLVHSQKFKSYVCCLILSKSISYQATVVSSLFSTDGFTKANEWQHCHLLSYLPSSLVLTLSLHLTLLSSSFLCLPRLVPPFLSLLLHSSLQPFPSQILSQILTL